MIYLIVIIYLVMLYYFIKTINSYRNEEEEE